jgi:hypothetical protein
MEKMKAYYVLTGELVRIVAKDEDEMWEMLSNGIYQEQETLSEIQEVNELNDEEWEEERNDWED